MKIYSVDLAKALNNKDIKCRPCVILEETEHTITVLPITSRMRPDRFHIRMDNYIIYGFCSINKPTTILKKYRKGFIRDCTKREENAIYQGVFQYYSK